MLDDARILGDREGFLGAVFVGFWRRLDRLGTKCIWRGSAWYWDLKPDYEPGEVFEI